MLVSCSYYRRIHEKNFDCGRKTKMRYRYSRDAESSKFRSSTKWQKKAWKFANEIIVSGNVVLGISLEHLAKSIDMDIFYCDNVEVHIKDFLNKRTSGYEWLDVFL